MLSWPSPGEKGTGRRGSERSRRHVHPSVFCPPSQLIGSCVRPPLPNPSSPLPRSSRYPFPFSHFYFSFHKSDRSSLRCAVTMATLHSAAGPHPLPLSSSPPSLPLSLPFSHHLQRLYGIKYWWWCFAPRPCSPLLSSSPPPSLPSFCVTPLSSPAELPPLVIPLSCFTCVLSWLSTFPLRFALPFSFCFWLTPLYLSFSSTPPSLVHIFAPLISPFFYCFANLGEETQHGRSYNTIEGWRLPIRPLPASSLRCGGIHIHYVAPLSPPPSQSCCLCPCFFSLLFSALHLCLFLPLSLSVSIWLPFLSVSLSPCLYGPPLGWLLLAAPVPPTLSLDMLFIGLQRGWLSVQGGCCLKQCSLNKRGRSSRRALWLMCSLSASVYRHQVHHEHPLSPFLPSALSPIQVTGNNYPKFPPKVLALAAKDALLSFSLIPLFSPLFHPSPFPAVLWSSSSPAARTTNSSTASHPRRRVPAASSPPLLLSPSPRRPRPTAVASSRSTSPSSQGAKPWTWPRSAVLPMAMQACTPPCHPSVRPPSTSTSSMCPAAWPAKSPTTGRPNLKARLRSLPPTSKVRITTDTSTFYSYPYIFEGILILKELLLSKPWRLFSGRDAHFAYLRGVKGKTISSFEQKHKQVDMCFLRTLKRISWPKNQCWIIIYSPLCQWKVRWSLKFDSINIYSYQFGILDRLYEAI